MNIFLKNRDFRQMSINEWISILGDTMFYLAFINYVSAYKFAPLAVLLITISETIPQIIQIFTGVAADFQKNRIKKYTIIALIKFILYTFVAIILLGSEFGILSVFLICGINLVSDTLGTFSGAMLTPIYMRIISDDMTQAMGFKQATSSLVRMFGNLLGGVLVGFISIGNFAAINALTFLLVFLGILLIKKDLIKYEEEIPPGRPMSFNGFLDHLKESLKILFGLKDVVRLLGILSISQAVMSILVPLSTLVLLKTSFYGLENGQSIAILTVMELVGLVFGSFLSGSLLKKMTTRSSIYLCQLMELLIIFGFANQSFLLIIIGAFGNALSVGVLSPRLQKAVFSLIPEKAMGAIQSAISTITVVFPGLLSIALVAVASSLGIMPAAICLGLLVVLAIGLILSMKEIPA
ncbi:MFS transporter [Streptococcaceae bacterium ESL0687]|nr:MFS transporter [Streptococcaceae bacterium ESL0687]